MSSFPELKKWRLIIRARWPLDCVYALVSPELHGYLKSRQLETLIDYEGLLPPLPVEVKEGGACGRGPTEKELMQLLMSQ